MEKLEKKIEVKSHQYAVGQFSDEYEEEIEVCRESFTAGYKAGMEEVKDIAIAYHKFANEHFFDWSNGEISELKPTAELFNDFIQKYYSPTPEV